MPNNLGTYSGVPSRAVAENAASPNPNYPAVIWSSTASKYLGWDGSKWAAMAPTATGATLGKALALGCAYI